MKGLFSGSRFFTYRRPYSVIVNVNEWDLEDFRLRAWRRFSLLGKDVPPLTPSERQRWTQLEKEGKLDWCVSSSSGTHRVLGGVPHVEKDKEILRTLMKHCVQKKTLHKQESMYQSIARPLQLGDDQNSCFEFLQRLGVVSEDTNPCLLRYSKPVHFTPQVLAEVPKLKKMYEDEHDETKSIREDLTDLPALTIDDIRAAEVDDAVGMFRDAQGNEWILVHVADPTRLVKPRSMIDNFCADRCSSIYLPERHFPMMPPEMAGDWFSIATDKISYTFTICALLREDGSLKGNSRSVTKNFV